MILLIQFLKRLEIMLLFVLSGIELRIIPGKVELKLYISWF